ncbi:serine hydroxymethyltransferase [Gordonia sp. PS3]|uniref:Probable serine hydroxymethyltransferase n=1 Tax=Gordonia sihwensis NBRC 108236 TaxID=1223544 RepID=L7LIR5_9ACTN|nr:MULTISPECIES: serine hydroxymethyltransferase [Gordonia]AUH69468.1 serine hydroxymethyltransferase [Gordonia sp. YC-JH1]GAC61005.1 serine hydroxymethyltransferase [Gordonia sihwensis NBRC 108236]
MTDPLASDPEIAELLRREETRRRGSLQMVAAESTATPAVRAAVGSILADKYAEGYPGHRYHGGAEVVDEVEQLAISRAHTLFGADYVNVQPLSWALANFAVYAAFSQPGDQVLSLNLKHGGHQSHGSRANLSGRWFSVLNYEVRRDTERIDYDQIRDLALIHRPRILVAGGTSYSRSWDFAAMRTIADEADCILWVDAAHLAGLAVGGVLDSPVPYADVVTVATNKVMRGPRGGLLLARSEHEDSLSRAVYPFMQGAPAMHSIAAKAVAFGECLRPEYAAYARDVADDAATLATELGARGLRTVSGGTDTHLAVIEVSSLGITGREAAKRLAACRIIVDKAVTPFDEAPVSEGSAIRFGTAVLAADGLRPADMPQIADLMLDAMRTDPSDEARRAAITAAVAAVGEG